MECSYWASERAYQCTLGPDAEAVAEVAPKEAADPAITVHVPQQRHRRHRLACTRLRQNLASRRRKNWSSRRSISFNPIAISCWHAIYRCFVLKQIHTMTLNKGATHDLPTMPAMAPPVSTRSWWSCNGYTQYRAGGYGTAGVAAIRRYGSHAGVVRMANDTARKGLANRSRQLQTASHFPLQGGTFGSSRGG
jgi:hypothetical protein